LPEIDPRARKRISKKLTKIFESKTGLSANEVEVLWVTLLDAYNELPISVEPIYSESEAFQLTDQQVRWFEVGLKRYLKRTPLLPPTHKQVGLWLRPQKGARFTLIDRV
jgi:hypothetical protein